MRFSIGERERKKKFFLLIPSSIEVIRHEGREGRDLKSCQFTDMSHSAASLALDIGEKQSLDASYGQ